MPSSTWTCTRVGWSRGISTFADEALARVGGRPREVVLRHRLPHCRSPVRQRLVLAGSTVSVVGRDGRRCVAAFVEAGGPWIRRRTIASAAHPADGNSIESRRSVSPVPRARSRHPGPLDARGSPPRQVKPLISTRTSRRFATRWPRTGRWSVGVPGAGKTTDSAGVNRWARLLLQPRRVAARAVARRIADERVLDDRP